MLVLKANVKWKVATYINVIYLFVKIGFFYVVIGNYLVASFSLSLLQVNCTEPKASKVLHNAF